MSTNFKNVILALNLQSQPRGTVVYSVWRLAFHWMLGGRRGEVHALAPHLHGQGLLVIGAMVHRYRYQIIHSPCLLACAEEVSQG